MTIEPRETFGVRSLVLIPDTPEESRLIDAYLGDRVPVLVTGKVDLADGYGTHYISLRAADTPAPAGGAR